MLYRDNGLSETSTLPGAAPLEQLLELMPAAVYTCAAPSGIITYYNRRAAELWGRRPHIGDTEERFCGSLRLCRPDGTLLPHSLTPMARVLNGAAPVRNEEVVIERPDGSRITVLVNIDPIKDADGNIAGAINVFQDITEQKRLFETLRDSEERYHRLIQKLPAAIYACDAEGRVTLFNAAAAALWGREPEIGKDSWCGSYRIYRPDGAAVPLDEYPMAIALKTGREISGEEIVIERRDGTRRNVLAHPMPMRDSFGTVIGAINMLVDITEHKRAEEAVRESELLYKAIGDSIPYGVWVCDHEGRAVYVSEAFLELIGLTKEQCAGFGWTAALDPDDAETVAAWQDCVRRGGLWDREIRFRGADGQWHPILSRGTPIRDSAGKIIAWVGINLDIAHLAHMRERARQQEEMLEQTHDAIFQFELYGPIIYWTRGAENLYGFSREEAIGQIPSEMLKSDCPGGIQAVRTALERDGSWNGELIHRTRDGREIIVESRMLLLRRPDGPPIVFETNHDITDRKRVEAVLRESEQRLRTQATELEQQLIASGRLVALGEVTASMAHEFNNPLGIIMGFVQDMLSNMQPSDPDYRSLQIIDEESKRCRKIVQDLMEFARPQTAELAGVTISDVIGKTLKLVENRCYKQKIEFQTEIAVDLPEIYADAQQLEQVLVNLYLNAIDAMPGGGKLTVAAKLEDSGATKPAVVITVADTGFGIAADDLPKVFKPFYTANKRRGLGLGLPICERIINNHGGRIHVQSQRGEGTTFQISLPLEHNRRD
jgi:PAS domain S-box-containing protein